MDTKDPLRILLKCVAIRLIDREEGTYGVEPYPKKSMVVFWRGDTYRAQQEDIAFVIDDGEKIFTVGKKYNLDITEAE